MTAYKPQYYTLRRIRLRGGYDSNTGAYYGVGAPVWEAELYADAIPGEGHGIGQYQGLDTIAFRAADRKAAHAHVKAHSPNIKYRP